MGMYDKLGTLLTEYLETGDLPPIRKKQKAAKPVEAAPKTEKPVPPKIPPALFTDFQTLQFQDLAVVPDLKTCRRAYHTLLKKYHPDTGKTDGTEEAAQNIKAITQAFRNIEEWYAKLIR
ncbi:MAG: J domain-containing protein [Treponema sp.]|nr:J domain-containing protein [Treponema sp.]